jgi:hypothetical protein
MPIPASDQLGIAQAVVTTLGTMLMVGIGFVSRPTRATALWSTAFVVEMIGTYAVFAGTTSHSATLRAVGLAVQLSALALLWSGLRARRGAAPRVWTAPAHFVVCLGLLLLADGSWANAAYSIAYLLTSAYAALILIEFRMLPERTSPLTWPLALVAGSMVVLAFFAIVTQILVWTHVTSGVQIVWTVISLGLIVFVICAIVSLLSLAFADPRSIRPGAASGLAAFRAVAQDRLARADERGERTWSLLVARIDDPTEIGRAGGAVALSSFGARFEADLRATFPADADFGRERIDSILILISRPDTQVRELVRSALERISTIDDDQPLAVRLSASVGWAPARPWGYDIDAMLTAGQDAASLAETAGGDTWRRTDPEGVTS